jgi:Secretion system C-terminal sorting domain
MKGRRGQEGYMLQRFSFRNIFKAFCLFVSLLITLNLPVKAQPSGETITGLALSGDYKFDGTGRDFTFSELTTSQATGKDYYKKVFTWRAPAGREIKGFNVKKGNADVVFILLDDGSVYESAYVGEGLGWGPPMFRTMTDPSGGYSGFLKMVGDALYTLSVNGVFVSRDTAATWSLDTAGVGAGLYADISVDTLQYVYLAHNNGLFKQHPDSIIWHKVSTFPGGSATSVFVDRMNRVYASTYGGIYLSTDGGATWASKTTGFTGGSVSHFSDDTFHNVYALGGAMVFRSDSGTGSWVRIDTAVTNLIHDPINSYASPFTSIAGDSTLFLGTTYGLFQSTDHGATWSEDDDDIAATTVYGYARSGTRQFETTTLGLYYNSLGDSLWTKSFPATGYQTGGPIYVDNAGILYSLGPVVNINNSQSPNSNWKSTDNGTTWQPDTAGLSAMAGGSIPKYFADENGIQHYAVAGITAQCFMKSSGTSWTPDTTGWGKLPGNYPNVLASDMHGNIYAALTTTTDYTGLLLRRPLSGGAWVLDTAGLQKAIVYSISNNQAGNLYAGTYGNGIFKKTGSTWAPISSPGGLNGNDAFVTAVDGSGALFAGFSYQSGYNYLWQGVYFTTNDGASWTKVGLDSIAVRALIAYGDSVYAVTYYDGLYVLTKTSATKVTAKDLAAPEEFELYQNYPNPFNPTTTISYHLSVISRVTLKVYDILGREVAVVPGEKENAGTHSIKFDGSRFASGMYFYRLEANTEDGRSFVSTRKLMLIK